jgi:hypothetical protein
MKKETFIVLLTFGIFLLAGSTMAEKVQQGIYNYNSLGGSYNPLGVLLDNRITMRFPLSARTGILWESTKLDIGIQNTWTPTDDIAGLRVTVVPVALFSLTATAGFFGMYTGLGYGLYSFPSATSRYGSSLPKDADRQSATGAWLSLEPELKLKISRLIIVNTFTANYLSLNRSGYFLELRSYSLHKTTDVDIINNANLLFEFNKSFLAGGTYRYLRVFGTGIESHRVAALAIILFPSSKLGNTFLATTAGAYLADPAFGQSPYLGLMAGMDLKIR